MNAYANGVEVSREHPGAHTHNPEAIYHEPLYFRVAILEQRFASACLVCFQSCLGVRGVRAAFMEACRHCELYQVVLYSERAQSVGRWLVGWLVGLFLATSAPAAATSAGRTLVVYINSYTMMPVFICPNTRTAYFYMRSLARSAAVQRCTQAARATLHAARKCLQFAKKHYAKI